MRASTHVRARIQRSCRLAGAADGNLYSPWTDGNVHDDGTGKNTGSGSGRRLQNTEADANGFVTSSSSSLGGDGAGGGPKRGKYDTTTGQAVIVGAHHPSTLLSIGCLFLACSRLCTLHAANVIRLTAAKNASRCSLVCHQATIPSLST